MLHGTSITKVFALVTIGCATIEVAILIIFHFCCVQRQHRDYAAPVSSCRHLRAPGSLPGISTHAQDLAFCSRQLVVPLDVASFGCLCSSSGCLHRDAGSSHLYLLPSLLAPVLLRAHPWAESWLLSRPGVPLHACVPIPASCLVPADGVHEPVPTCALILHEDEAITGHVPILVADGAACAGPHHVDLRLSRVVVPVIWSRRLVHLRFDFVACRCRCLHHRSSQRVGHGRDGLPDEAQLLDEC